MKWLPFENSEVSWGGLLFGMFMITFIGCLSACGGSPLANSIAVIPKHYQFMTVSQVEIT